MSRSQSEEGQDQYQGRASVPPPTRVQAACRRCHQRKKKCDRALPRCSNCSRPGEECVYDPIQTDSEKRMAIAELQAENEELRQLVERLERKLNNHVIPTFASLPDEPPTVCVSASSNHHPEPTISELFIAQLMNAEIDSFGTAQLQLQNIAQQFGMTLPPTNQRKSASVRPAAATTPAASLPTKQQAELLVKTYFEFGNAFQPVLNPETVVADMQHLFPEGVASPTTFEEITQPDVRIYRIFIVFAIGSSLLSEDSDRLNTAQLRSTALANFPAALRADELTCLTCIVLFCLYSMTDSAPMNPHHTVKVAAKLAIALGFNKDNEALPCETREMRKRVYWSLYCMDRSISFSLDRPLIFRDDEIQTDLPSILPSLYGQHTTFMHPVTLFRETVRLRRLQGSVSSELYAGAQIGQNSEGTLARIRNNIDVWFENLPILYSPLTWRATKHPYLEVNYHLLLVRLYSPSPLMSQPSQGGMGILRRSAYRVIEMYGAGHEGYRMRQNYITISHIVLACSALIYSLSECEGDSFNLSLRTWRLSALQQIESAEKLLADFCGGLSYATQYTETTAHLARDLKARLQDMNAVEPPPDWLSTNTSDQLDNVFPIHTSNLDELLGANLADPQFDGIKSSAENNAAVVVDNTVDDFLAMFDLENFPR